MTTLMDAVGRALKKAGHPAARGRLAGWKLVGYAERVDVVWLPETRRRSRDRVADALKQAEAHAASAREAGWEATVGEDGGWPVCRVSRPQAVTGEAA